MDSIHYQVVRNHLLMIAEEAGMRAARSAGSTFVAQGNSVASALFDRTGRLIAQTSGGQQHVSAIRLMLGEVLQDFPPDLLEDGDVILNNNHFRGGIHPTDLAAFRPIFHNGRAEYFSGILMVVSDMGGISAGSLPANATEIFHEGLVLSPIKLFAAGKRNDALMTVLRVNSRTPGKLIADVEALVAAGYMAAERMGDLIAKYGTDDLVEVIEALLDHAERMTREGLGSIPDGIYIGSYTAEPDGIDEDLLYPVHVEIEIKGDACRIDFSGSAPQAAGAINCSYSQSVSFIAFALRCYLDPEIPMNEGFYRPLDMRLPHGTVVNAAYPSACNLRFSVGQAMIDAIHMALRPVFPERTVAPSGSLTSVNAHGEKRNIENFWSAFDVSFGPGGARSGLDGVDGLPFPMIGVAGYMRSIEVYESRYPLIYWRYALEPDSAGAGTWRGGAGLAKDIEFLEDGQVTLRATDRSLLPPQGIAGGHAALGCSFTINRNRDDSRTLPSKITNYPIRRGDILTSIVSGGGGFGPPEERDPDWVLTDVRSGIVSPEKAREIYHVAITRAGGIAAIDHTATRLLRGN